ncbi:MAG: DUF2666 family protein [Candidatus Micrarchaeia archaeon]
MEEINEPEEYVQFFAKYKDWVSIKKYGIYNDTKPEEIAFDLTLIRRTLDNKIYKLLGINLDILDKFADSATAGGKKSASLLTTTIEKFLSNEAKSAIENACGNDKKLKPIAEAYLLNKLITNAGYETAIDPITLSKIYPYLKLPKEITMALKRGKKKKENE